MNAVAQKSLKELTAGLVDVPAGIVVTDVTIDSRAASPGSLFLACRGRSHHGLEFAGRPSRAARESCCTNRRTKRRACRTSARRSSLRPCRS
jgi:UDP-N-acetylmuramyl pentapeptide synthase